MKSVSGKDFAKTLERHGWKLLRVQGSHHIYGKVGTSVRLSWHSGDKLECSSTSWKWLALLKMICKLESPPTSSSTLPTTTSVYS